MNILYSILMIVVGFACTVYAFQIVRMFGHLDWAERYLGPGGSYTAWRLIGVALIVGGIFFIRNPFF